MSVYVLSDPHLSLSCDKPMDVFGGRWDGYTEKLKLNISALSENDILIMPGDISWGMNLDEAYADLRFLNSLPGIKILGKGNHDYWWTTMSKMEKYVAEKGLSKIRFLFNNAYLCEDFVAAGSRGWYLDAEVKGCDNKKIIARECGRLEMSVKEAEKIASENGVGKIKVFTHYPAVFGDYRCDEITDVLVKHGISECWYGHLHGFDKTKLVEEYRGVSFHNCSADYLNFNPFKIN